MKILSIESSCDETSVAIVEDGKKVYSNVIFTQIDIHTKYGGVVPEIASRHHIEKITYVIDEALKEAKMTPNDVDYIACYVVPMGKCILVPIEEIGSKKSITVRIAPPNNN